MPGFLLLIVGARRHRKGNGFCFSWKRRAVPPCSTYGYDLFARTAAVGGATAVALVNSRVLLLLPLLVVNCCFCDCHQWATAVALEENSFCGVFNSREACVFCVPLFLLFLVLFVLVPSVTPAPLTVAVVRATAPGKVGLDWRYGVDCWLWGVAVS